MDEDDGQKLECGLPLEGTGRIGDGEGGTEAGTDTDNSRASPLRQLPLAVDPALFYLWHFTQFVFRSKARLPLWHIPQKKPFSIWAIVMF